MLRPSAVSKVNHSALFARKVRAHIGELRAQHRLDLAAAFASLDVPGERNEIAPEAFGLDHQRRAIDVAALERRAELRSQAEFGVRGEFRKVLAGVTNSHPDPELRFGGVSATSATQAVSRWRSRGAGIRSDRGRWRWTKKRHEELRQQALRPSTAMKGQAPRPSIWRVSVVLARGVSTDPLTRRRPAARASRAGVAGLETDARCKADRPRGSPSIAARRCRLSPWAEPEGQRVQSSAPAHFRVLAAAGRRRR